MDRRSISRCVGCHTSTVDYWQNRDNISEMPRSGRPVTFDDNLYSLLTGFYCQTRPFFDSGRWKVGLQNTICNKYGIKVTVCHFPPDASKWNPIEHKVFSEISKNWKGAPLIDYETVLKYTQTTKTIKGLKVNAVLVDKKYAKGIKATKNDLEKMNYPAASRRGIRRVATE